MTREEAIIELNTFKIGAKSELGENALDMAIKALEQEPCEDCVSRKAILKEIPLLWNSNGDKDYCMETLRDFVTELPLVTPARQKGKWIPRKANIKNSPSVTPTSKWIPVDDRLPEENEYVLLCNSQGTMEVGYYHIDATCYPTEYADLNDTGWYDNDDDALYFEPVAWMPLPESYKAEMEGGFML